MFPNHFLYLSFNPFPFKIKGTIFNKRFCFVSSRFALIIYSAYSLCFDKDKELKLSLTFLSFLEKSLSSFGPKSSQVRVQSIKPFHRPTIFGIIRSNISSKSNQFPFFICFVIFIFNWISLRNADITICQNGDKKEIKNPIQLLHLPNIDKNLNTGI